MVLSLLLHPECQRKAQAEIDYVVGHTRLPDFSDRAALPYLEALAQECKRVHAVTPLGETFIVIYRFVSDAHFKVGVPHRSMEDDVYKGMYIPKGSTIIANPK